MESSSPSKFNMRHPAVKRILQEIKEIREDTSGGFIAEALESDIFEWHFVMRGPSDSEFEGGIYHGRILLPADYPFKPPSFMMLSPNGRFETGMKICLSISSHHPEHWQPSWSVRTALTALIAFMPTPGHGALGSLEFSKDERRALAAKSRTEVPKFGSAERQKVIDEMHQRMLAVEVLHKGAPSAADAAAASGDFIAPAGAAAPQVAQQQATQAGATSGEASSLPNLQGSRTTERQEGVAVASSSAAEVLMPRGDGGAAASLPLSLVAAACAFVGTAPAAASTPLAGGPAPAGAPAPAAASPRAVVPAPATLPQQQASAATAALHAASVTPALQQAQQLSAVSQSDRGLTLAAIALSVAIAAILLRKLCVAMGMEMPSMEYRH